MVLPLNRARVWSTPNAEIFENTRSKLKKKGKEEGKLERKVYRSEQLTIVAKLTVSIVLEASLPESQVSKPGISEKAKAASLALDRPASGRVNAVGRSRHCCPGHEAGGGNYRDEGIGIARRSDENCHLSQ